MSLASRGGGTAPRPGAFFEEHATRAAAASATPPDQAITRPDAPSSCLMRTHPGKKVLHPLCARRGGGERPFGRHSVLPPAAVDSPAGGGEYEAGWIAGGGATGRDPIRWPWARAGWRWPSASRAPPCRATACGRP